MRRTIALATSVPLMLAALGPTVLAADEAMMAEGQQADMVENFAQEAFGTPDLLIPENAMIERGPDGLTFLVMIPTPEPGSYTYPEAIPEERHAAPEAFSGWAAVFNYPEHCVTNSEPPFCGGEDFNDQVKGGLHNFGGYASSLTQHGGGEIILDEATDGMVVLSGGFDVGDPPRDDMPEGAVRFPLENPMGAEVHVIIAPHGQLDLANAAELYTPMGAPGCDCNWVATFIPTQ